MITEETKTKLAELKRQIKKKYKNAYQEYAGVHVKIGLTNSKTVIVLVLRHEEEEWTKNTQETFANAKSFVEKQCKKLDIIFDEVKIKGVYSPEQRY